MNKTVKTTDPKQKKKQNICFQDGTGKQDRQTVSEDVRIV